MVKNKLFGRNPLNIGHVVNLDDVQNQWFMRPKHCFFTTEEASELKTKFRNEFFRKNWVYTRVSYLILCLFSEILRLVNLDEDRGGARQISADESTFLDVQTLKRGAVTFFQLSGSVCSQTDYKHSKNKRCRWQNVRSLLFVEFVVFSQSKATFLP